MLFAVAGSQGSGKSSVLAGLESRGYEVMQRKISRSVLADWNVTLEEVNTNLPLSLKFQDEVVKRKAEDECQAVVSDNIVFTERSYMDSFVYYLFTFGCQESMSGKINDYHQLCAGCNETYTSVFFLPSGRFKTVADGVRGTNPHYVKAVDMILKQQTIDYSSDVYDVVSDSIVMRVTEIETYAQGLMERSLTA